MDNFENIVCLKVNGTTYKCRIKNNWTLLEVLRGELGLTGTKCGCGKGECGCCTVLMNGKPILSCLTLAITADGQKIETIEGLAANGKLHPIQQSFIDHGAVQCGFCTPGMIMSAKALLDQDPIPSEEAVRNSINGNLCRCTGYAKIVEAILAVGCKTRESRPRF